MVRGAAQRLATCSVVADGEVGILKNNDRPLQVDTMLGGTVLHFHDILLRLGLALAVGSKGYHDEVFAGGPYPV